jgi:tetratricopeptide (TPR) repeat protein
LQLALIAIAGSALAAADSKPPSFLELASRLDQAAAQVRTAADNLKVVETQYTQRALPSGEELLERRFSNGEIQYLLGNFQGALVLFYDLVSDNRFQATVHYPDALYYLAEGLYQQQNYWSARLYLRQLMALPASRSDFRVAPLSLEIASKLNDFSGIDEFAAQAKAGGVEWRPEVRYLYGKSLLNRTDLSAEARAARLSEALQPLVDDPQSELRAQSAYLLAVGEVQRGDLPAAAERFRQLAELPARTASQRKIKELANLSAGRVYFELGEYDKAIDHYQEIPRESDAFPESLFEMAWCYVKLKNYERAKNATDILVLIDPDSTLSPESRLLQAHLLSELTRFSEAAQSYDEIVRTYAPVRDQIDRLLKARQDPVVYFDNLLRRSDRVLDVSSLLPPLALKWANTQREVADALRMVKDLETGRTGVDESAELSSRLLRAIDERGFTLFPTLQEGFARVGAVDSSLVLVDRALLSVETALSNDAISLEQHRQRAQLVEQGASLEKQLLALPASEKDVQVRRQQILERLEADDKEAFKLDYEIQSMQASLAAVQKWVHDTKPLRSNGPMAEKEFLGRVKAEESEISVLRKQLQQLRQALADSRGSVDAAVSGGGEIRGRYREQMEREHALLAEGETRLWGEAAALVAKAHQIRSQAKELEQRVAEARRVLRARVASRAKEIRDKVAQEQTLVGVYQTEVRAASENAQNLVGRIAINSFQRVRRQFYELVQKADVGLIDVAFGRKQSKTEEIQKLAVQRDQDLRQMDQEFKEVLEDKD